MLFLDISQRPSVGLDQHPSPLNRRLGCFKRFLFFALFPQNLSQIVIRRSLVGKPVVIDILVGYNQYSRIRIINGKPGMWCI